MHSEFLIVGGGVIGLTTALRLAEQGGRVTVLERRSIGSEASWAGAGMLPPANVADEDSAESRLRTCSHALWPAFSDTLRDVTGIDNGFRVCGAVELDDDSHPDALATLHEQLKREQIACEDLSGHDALARYVPGLHHRVTRGLFIPGFAQVRNPRHLKALGLACRTQGVSIVEHCETLRLLANGSSIAVDDGRDVHHAPRILLAAGAWTPALLASIGVTLPVEPVRGQIVALQSSQLPFTMVIEQGPRYLVPREDGLILVGSTMEHCGFEKHTTAAGQQQLLSFALSVIPELATARVAHSWAGLRPGSPDGLPFLGRVAGSDQLFVAAGHFRSGLQMSVGTAEVLANLMQDRPPGIALDGLEADRFSGCEPSGRRPVRPHSV